MGSLPKSALLLKISVFALLTLNVVLLWRDQNIRQVVTETQLKLHHANVKVRIAESVSVFGHTFIPDFNIVTLNEKPSSVPNLGEQTMIVLFFKSRDCTSCLEAMGGLYLNLHSEIPIVGVTQNSATSEVQRSIQQYDLRFPVFIAQDNPFNMLDSPYCVLVDRNKNILYLSKIDPFQKDVSLNISEIKQILERR